MAMSSSNQPHSRSASRKQAADAVSDPWIDVVDQVAEGFRHLLCGHIPGIGQFRSLNAMSASGTRAWR